MSVYTFKTKSVLRFASVLKPLNILSACAWLGLIGCGVLIISAQHPTATVADKKPTAGTKAQPTAEVAVAQVQGAETTVTAPALPSLPAIVTAPTAEAKPTSAPPQIAPANFVAAITPTTDTTPIVSAPVIEVTPTPIIEIPVITPVQQPVSFAVTAPAAISIARGSSATLTYSVVDGSSATWQGYYKNTIYSNGDNESPTAPFHIVVPFSGSYVGSSVTFTVTVDATAAPGDTNEVALYVTSAQGQAMTATTKLTIL